METRRSNFGYAFIVLGVVALIWLGVAQGNWLTGAIICVVGVVLGALFVWRDRRR